MLDMIREDGRRRNRLSKMKYVADMTFTVDRLWVEHKGSFDMMTKRSRGVRMLAEVFQEIATPRGMPPGLDHWKMWAHSHPLTTSTACGAHHRNRLPSHLRYSIDVPRDPQEMARW